MSDHSRRQPDGDVPRRIAVASVAAFAAALVGWSVLPPPGYLPWWIPLAVVLGAVALAAPIAILLVRPPEPASASLSSPWGGTGTARMSERESDDRPAAWDAAGAGRSANRAGAHDPGATQLVLPVGLPPPTGSSAGSATGDAPAAGQWWNRGAPAPAKGGAATTRPIAAPPADLARWREAPRIVQCPRCGAFRIDARQTDSGGYAFRCRVDDHQWAWRPGTAWPATVVASRRRIPR